MEQCKSCRGSGKCGGCGGSCCVSSDGCQKCGGSGGIHPGGSNRLRGSGKCSPCAGTGRVMGTIATVFLTGEHITVCTLGGEVITQLCLSDGITLRALRSAVQHGSGREGAGVRLVCDSGQELSRKFDHTILCPDTRLSDLSESQQPSASRPQKHPQVTKQTELDDGRSSRASAAANENARRGPSRTSRKRQRSTSPDADTFLHCFL